VTPAADLIKWSDWLPLNQSWANPLVPQLPGLYRIRREGRDDLDYIGQTSTLLRQRLGALRGVYGEEMPYRAPHTAGPALWALRSVSVSGFEVSVAPDEGQGRWRKGQEALAISLYRQERNGSPTVEFGRMPAGFRMSSGSNAQLVRADKRFRGGTMVEADASHLPSLKPAGPFIGHPQSTTWCGHHWSEWIPLVEAFGGKSADGEGLYRLRGEESGRLLYIGQGIVRQRLAAHLAKRLDPKHDQCPLLAAAPRLDCSWVLNGTWFRHQRLELETDLIAAHVLALREIPAMQWLG